MADSQAVAATTRLVNEKNNLRQAVRALIIDPSDRFLLTSVAVGDWRGWVLPGGGVESGEDHATALRRELAEEVGVPEVFIGPMVCRRTFYSTDMGSYDGQVNYIYLVPCHEFEVNPSMSDAELRAEGVLGSEWWTITELEATSEELRPQSLPDLAKLVLEYGAPSEPVIIESPA